MYALCILHGSSLERLAGIFSQHNLVMNGVYWYFPLHDEIYLLTILFYGQSLNAAVLSFCTHIYQTS